MSNDQVTNTDNNEEGIVETTEFEIIELSKAMPLSDYWMADGEIGDYLKTVNVGIRKASAPIQTLHKQSLGIIKPNVVPETVGRKISRNIGITLLQMNKKGILNPPLHLKTINQIVEMTDQITTTRSETNGSFKGGAIFAQHDLASNGVLHVAAALGSRKQKNQPKQ